MRGLKGFGFNALTQWVPGLILVFGLGGGDISASLWLYFLGYLAFISIYEIGYLANDSYGLKHDATPRRRISFAITPAFITLFVALRLTVVVAVAAHLGILLEPWFLLIVAGLCAVIILHNTVGQQAYKFATFFQMSLLRFSTPILIALGGQHGAVVLASGVFLFVFPRFLTYQHSKDRLRIPERDRPEFRLLTLALCGPAVMAVSLFSGAWAVIYAWAYLLLLHGSIGLASRSQRVSALLATVGVTHKSREP